MSNDPVLAKFLRRQLRAGLQLAARSDRLKLQPIWRPGAPPMRYRARYCCCGVLREDDGQIVVREAQFTVGITFTEHHLRHVDPLRVVTWLGPANIFHSNVRAPVMCVGHVHAGVELIDLLYGCYEMITFLNWSSSDALDHEAAAWVRRHQHLLPVDRRPMCRPVGKQLAGNK